MSAKVVKRDGGTQFFDLSKIERSLQVAMGERELPGASDVLNQMVCTIRERVNGHCNIKTSVLHDCIIEILSQYNQEAASNYKKNYAIKEKSREASSDLYSAVMSLINRDNEALLNENANKDSQIIPTQRDLLAGVIAKHFALRHILPEAIAEAHISGDIHYHDLDYSPFFPMFNCMLIDLEGMLTRGFKMGNAEIETPQSISTATAVTAQIIAQVSSHIYGGNSINQIDKIHAPYVTKSYEKHLTEGRQWIDCPEKAEAYACKMTEKECYDAYQSLEYEVNTLHTANGQTPFVTFGFGLGTTWQERLIQKSILQNRLNGLGKKSKTAIFPKLVYAIRKGVNFNNDDPNYDIKQLALQCSAKRMYPDILNYDQVIEVTGSFKTPMGCRSFLDVYEQEGKQIHDGRNNMGVVSINLPRIAIESNSESDFYQRLAGRLQIAKAALLTRVERLEKVPAKVAPILYMEGACGIRLKAEDSIGQLFKQGRASLSLGYIGIHETVRALYREGSIFDSDQLKQKGLAIVSFLAEATKQWKQETGIGFSLYSTPSESLCDRFCRLDKERFGEIPGINDKGYYTNSFHLDVERKVNPYEKIDFEKEYPAIATGGFICFGEFPVVEHNLKALENVWDYTYDKVPYYGANIPIDQCYTCGFQGEFTPTNRGFSCPECRNTDSQLMSVTRRVCGYLGQPNSRPFIRGKQQEVIRRVKHETTSRA